jgi:hypothetical protein
MAMGGGHPLKRVGRDFVRNLFWMLVIFGPLAAIFIIAAGVPLLRVVVVVGSFVAVVAAVVTLLAL